MHNLEVDPLPRLCLQGTPRLREVQFQSVGASRQGQAHFRNGLSGFVPPICVMTLAASLFYFCRSQVDSSTAPADQPATLLRGCSYSFSSPIRSHTDCRRSCHCQPSHTTTLIRKPRHQLDRPICAHIDIMAPILNFHAGSLPSFALRLKSDDSLER